MFWLMTYFRSPIETQLLSSLQYCMVVLSQEFRRQFLWIVVAHIVFHTIHVVFYRQFFKVPLLCSKPFLHVYLAIFFINLCNKIVKREGATSSKSASGSQKNVFKFSLNAMARPSRVSLFASWLLSFASADNDAICYLSWVVFVFIF